MKKYLTLILIIYSMGNVFAQNNPNGFSTDSRDLRFDTIKPKKQPIDSSKYFYRRFLKLKSQGVPDSVNPFKQKLLNYKNKSKNEK